MIGYLLYPRGYCYGVKRIANMMEQVLKLYNSVYLIEDIVKNKIFMDSVQAKGAIKVSSIDDIPDGSAIIFSTRGISPKILKKEEDKQLTIIDATCPVIKDLQNKVIAKADAGYAIILIGNRAHQEISTLFALVDNSAVYIVNSEIDIDLLPNLEDKKVAYFTQTSLFPGNVEKIIDSLKSNIPHIEPGGESNNNICAETLDRQKVITEIADKIDLLIVLGDALSANAMSLVHTGEASGVKRVVRIDSQTSIQKDILDDVSQFALVSSNSVSETVIKDVENSLQNLAGIEYVAYPTPTN